MSKAELIQLITGMATLINSVILWPLMKRQDRRHTEHEVRIQRLEDK